jgi:cobalt-zinc-cadmium efflux system outer membrane protein
VLGAPELPQRLLAGSLDAPPDDLKWDEQLQRLLAGSPEMAMAAEELQRARWQLDRACAEVTPDVNMQAGVFHNNVTTATMAAVHVGVPIPLFDRNQGAIAEARSRIVAAERNIQRIELDLQRRLARVFRQYEDTRFQVETYSKEIVPKAKETFRLVGDGFRLGEIGYLDMLTAERTYFQALLAHIDSQRESWRALLEIDGLLVDVDSRAGVEP